MKEQLPFRPPVLQNYMDAVWTEGYFSPEEVAQLSALYEATDKKAAEVSNEGNVQNEVRKSTIAFIEPGEEVFASVMQKLAQYAIHINNQHYGFDLMGFYEAIQIAEYGVEDFFTWHSDFSAGTASTRKLSLSIQLSEPDAYEGGDLQFKVSDQEVNAPRTLGTVIAFPSYVLHRVTPITSGKRRSMVGWVTGVPFR